MPRCPADTKACIACMHPLRARAAHLADVDGGVERAADVHAQVGAQQVEVARQRVQVHLADGRAVAEVVEGRLAAEAGHAGRGVEAMRAQVHAVHVGRLHDLHKCRPRHARLVRRQALVELRARVRDCAAIAQQQLARARQSHFGIMLLSSTQRMA